MEELGSILEMTKDQSTQKEQDQVNNINLFLLYYIP